jgi:diguanylate cyclase
MCLPRFERLRDVCEANSMESNTILDYMTANETLSETDAAESAALALALERSETIATAQLRVFCDSLTALPNRDLFDDRLAHAISLADRHGWTLAVMFLGLDHFKSINDLHGHATGDCVLKEVAQRLLDHSRAEDTVCRNGGDEFLYLLVNPQGTENTARIASQILTHIAQPIAIDDLKLAISASIGIAVYPKNGTTGEQLIRNADTAMYRAKKHMGGAVFIHAVEMG